MNVSFRKNRWLPGAGALSVAALLGASAALRAADALEPNDTPDKATSLKPGVAVASSLHPGTDVDWFRFDLPGASTGEVEVTIRQVPESARLRLRLLDAQQKEIDEQYRYEGTPLFCRFPPLAPGAYFLELKDAGAAYRRRGDTNPPPESAMELRLDVFPDAFPGEPNNEPTNAVVLAAGQPAKGNLNPGGDTDWYRLDIPSNAVPAELTVEIPQLPAGMKPQVQVTDVRGYSTFGSRAEPYAGRPLSFRCVVKEGGPVFIRVQSADYGTRFLEPYTVVAGFESLAARDAKRHTTIAAAIPLPPGQAKEETIDPAGDVDVFRIDIPEPGRGSLDVSLRNVPDAIAPGIALLDAEGKELEKTSRPAGSDLFYRRELDRPGAYFLKVHSAEHRDAGGWWGADAMSSPQPYRVRADFLPARDAFEPNPNHDAARVIALGATNTATIFPRGDQDYYRVTVPAGKRGVLDVRLDGLPDHIFPGLRLDGADRKPVLESRPARGQPAALAATVRDGGDFFLVVRAAEGQNGRNWEGWDSASSMEPYTLVASFREIADAGEPDDAPEKARVLAPGKPASFVLFPAGDPDFFKIDIPASGTGRTWLVEASGFPEHLCPVLDLNAPGGAHLGHVHRKQPTLLLFFTPPQPGAYTIRVSPADYHRGRRIGGGEQYDDRPCALTVAPLPARVAGEAAEAEPDDDFPRAVTLRDGATTWGRIDKPGDADWYRFAVRAAADVDVQIRAAPPSLNLLSTVHFRPGPDPAGPPPAVLFLPSPRGDFNLADRHPDVAFTRVPQTDPKAKTVFANPEELRAYRAIVLDGLHEPDRYDLKNPRVQQNIRSYVEGGGRFVVLAPFCNLDFMGLTVEQAGRWHENEVVDIGSAHPLLAGPNRGTVRNWPHNESIGFLRGWREAGFEMLFAHVSDPASNAVTVVRAQGRGLTIVDTQNIGYHAHWPVADWKFRAWLGLPALTGLGLFNDTTHNDRASADGQPESFRVRAPGAGTLFVSVLEANRRADDKRDYAVRVRSSPAPADAGVARRPHEAARIELPAAGGAAATDVRLPRDGDRAWFRFDGRSNTEAVLSLDGVPPGANPRLRLFTRPKGAPPLPERKILFLRGEHGEFDLDAFYPGLDVERVEWRDARAPAILLDAGRLSAYRAVILQGLTRPGDFGFDRPAARATIERYVTAGGRFLLLTPVCPLNAFGVTNELAYGWQQDNVRELYPPHPLLAARRAADRVNGWPSAETYGWWMRGTSDVFEPVLAEWRNPNRHAVTLQRKLGQGLIVLDSQPVGHRDGQRESAWKLAAYLGLDFDLEPVGTWDNTRRAGWGGGEQARLALQESAYFLEVANLEPTAPDRAMTLSVSVSAPPARPQEPDDTPALAKPLAPGQPLTANLWPAGDEDWRRIDAYGRGQSVLRLLDPPDNVDPLLRIVRPATAAAKPVRVLYLEADPACDLDATRFENVTVERVNAASPAAAAALDRLGNADVLVLANFSDARQFGLNRREAHAKILAFASAGGRVVVASAGGFSFAENSPQMGAALEGASSQWDGGTWHAAHACDGWKVPGQGGCGWCCGRGAKFPHWIAWSFPGGPRTLDRAAVYNNSQRPESCVKDVEVQVGDDGKTFRTVAEASLVTGDERQEIRFPAVSCRHVRLLIKSNHGHAVETQLGEVEFYGPASLEPFFGARLEGGWPSSSAEPVDPAHPLLRRRGAGDVRGWPDAYHNGWWTGWDRTTATAVCAETSDPDRRAATLWRPVGKGWIALDTQRLTWRVNAAASEWKWRNYLDVGSVRAVEVDGTQGRAAGGFETATMDQLDDTPRLVRVTDNPLTGNLSNQSSKPYVLETDFLSDPSPSEPDDRPAQAALLAWGATNLVRMFPAGDEDWFRLSVDKPSTIRLSIEGVPANLDPVVEVFHAREDLKSPRVLYLACRPDSDLDRRCYGPVPLSFTRIEPWSEAAATAWDRLADHDVAILEGLDDLRRFGMDRPETWKRIEDFAARGGLFVLLAPARYSFSLANEAAGGRLVRCSDQYNNGSSAARNLVDGHWQPNNYEGGWISGSGAKKPHEFVFEFGWGTSAADVDRVAIHNVGYPSNECAKTVEVFFADRDEASAWRSAGRFECGAVPDRQEFRFAPVKARFARVLIHDNHGSARRTQLAEIEFFGPGRPEYLFNVPFERGRGSGYLSAPDTNHWIVARRAPLFEQGRYLSAEYSGTFREWAAAGFAAPLVSRTDTNGAALTVCKRVGSGWIVLDAQELGRPNRADAVEPKLLNYFDLPAARRGRYRNTLGDDRPDEDIRFFADPGSWYVRVFNSVTSRQSLAAFSLTAAATPALRPFEPNDEPALAAAPGPGDGLLNTLYPENDVDWFRFDLASNAALLVEATDLPPELGLGIEMFSATNLESSLYRFTGSQGGYGGAPDLFVFRAPAAGRYFMRLSPAGYSGGISPRPIRLRCDYRPAAPAPPPAVRSMAPADGSRDLPPRPEIALYFNAPLPPSAANSPLLSVTGSKSGAVPGRWQYDPALYRLAFAPARDLQPGETVTVSAKPGLAGLLGGALEKEAAATFAIRPPAEELAECTLQIALDPAPPLKAGAARVRLVPSSRLREPPRLSASASDGTALPVSAPEKLADGSWIATLTVPAGAKSQAAVFSVAAVDARGRPANRILQGRAFRIDADPPPAVPSISVVPARNGAARLAWAAPADVSDVAGYDLLRSTSPAPGSGTLVQAVAGARSLTWDDPTPSDGLWYYQVAARDEAGNRGPPSAVAMVATDRVPPPVVVEGVRAEVTQKPRIDIRWKKAAGTEGYAVFRAKRGEAPPDPATARPLLEAPPDRLEMSETIADGDYLYHVGARDTAGNVGRLSVPAAVVLDTRIAEARVRFPAAPPLMPGAHAIRLSLNEPLSTPLAFSARMPDGKTRELPAKRIDDLNYEVPFTVAEGEPDGWVYFSASGTDRYGNAGVKIVENSGVTIDSSPPRAWIHVKEGARLGLGRNPVTVDFSEEVRDNPTLFYAAGGRETAVPLKRQSGNRFTGEIVLAPDAPNGEAVCRVLAEDRFGHKGGQVAGGGRFTIDTQVPDAPLGVAVRPAPQRSLELSWSASMREPVAFYRVYAASNRPVANAPDLRLADAVRDTRAAVQPKAGGALWFAVCAVDLAGNESPPSEAVRGEIDVTPPPPPSGATVTLQEDGRLRVAWKPSAAMEPVTYAVFRSESPAPADVSSLKAVLETGEAWIVDAPEKPALLHYAVSAVDAAGNRSAPASAAPFDFDTEPPQAMLSFTPVGGTREYYESTYVHYTLAVLNAGTVTVSVTAHEPLAAAPALAYRTRTMDTPRPVALRPAGENKWTGAMVVRAGGADDGLATFHFSGVDRKGNRGTEIRKGRGHLAYVDTTPPEPVHPLKAVSRPLGRVGLEWPRPPGEGWGEVTYDLYRSARPFASTAGLAPLATGLREEKFEDAPAKDGTNHYAVVAVDRGGNRGRPAPSVAAVSDATPPAAPTGLRADVRGTVQLTWNAPADGGRLAYRVRRNGVVVAAAHPETSFADYPDKAGRCAYDVTAIDAAGNESVPSQPVALDFTDKLPVALIATEPASPVKSVFRVTLASSQPLREPPELFLYFARGEPLRIGLEPKDAGRLAWVGSVPVDADTPNGPARFEFRGVDKNGLAGTRIRGGETLVVDTRPPSAEVRLVPPSPVKTGRVKVFLRPSEPLAATPALRLTTLGAAPRDVSLAPADSEYAGEFDVADTDRDGIAFFTWSGTDLAGNVGARLGNERFVIDHHAPNPPPALTAVSLPDGYVELAWAAPAYRADETADQVAGYNVYAADAAVRQTAGLKPLEAGVTRIPCRVRPPADGRWFFAVTTVDTAGLESPPSPPAAALSDRTPPLPPRVTAADARAGAIDLAWETATDTVSCALFAQEPGAEAFVAVAEHVTNRSWRYKPLAGGRYAFQVQAVDALGHKSPPSPPRVVQFEQLAPLARIATTAPRLGAGVHAVKLETTRPLSKPPVVTFRSPKGPATPVAMRGAGKVWTGSLAVGPALGEGTGRFDYAGATAGPDGREIAGDGILSGAAVELDFTPPAAALEFAAAPPDRDGKPILKTGRYPFRLTFDEPLRDDPALSFTPRGGKTAPLDLVRQSPTDWIGVLNVSTNTGDGAAVFEVKAVDTQGNAGDAIVRNRNIDIDTTPPAGVEQIRAVVLPGGRCRVDWTPPMTGGRPDVDANLFRIYRSESEIRDVTGAAPYRVQRKVLGFVDEPREDRTYHYAVVAEDSAGNVGALSANASASVDKRPPDAPRNVEVSVTTGGVVHLAWKPPEGEATFFYNVYMAPHPILSTKGLEPRNRGITWTEIYGAPNDDGVYYFAVTAVDAALNESAPSESARLDYRGIPPIASFAIAPDASGAGAGASPAQRVVPSKASATNVASRIQLTDGRYRVRLATTKNLAEPPRVVVTTGDKRRIPLTFEGGGRAWSAPLVIDAGYPEGVYGFSFRGVDADGNLGEETEEGPLFRVDRTRPLPPGGLTVESDREGTPGAVVLKWETPKKAGAQTEVPNFYRVYRSTRPIETIAGLEPVQGVTVVYENLDEYSIRDLPPENGTYHYAVTSLDVARNESEPSESFRIDVQSDAPRATFDLFRVENGRVEPCPVDAEGRAVVGLGTWRAVVRTAVPLSAPPEVSWSLKSGEGRPVPLAMRGSGATWVGDFTVSSNRGDVVTAFFRFSGVSASGRPGVYIGRGAEFRIDTEPPAPDVIIPSTYKMLVHVKRNAVLTPPVKAGRIAVRLSCFEEFAQAPTLAFRLGDGPRVPIPLTGFGAEWTGYMDIPADAGKKEGRFFFEGVDRAGNRSTTIAKLRIVKDVDDDTNPPRVIANYATTGGSFTTDTDPPEAPAALETEMRKLGVAVIKWKEPAGEPNTYNLYRSLAPAIPLDGSLKPVKTGIFATVIVDDPPVDGNYFYAVSSVDFAGNESPLSPWKSVFIDTIKPELKIKAVPTGDGFVILVDEDAPPELSLTLNFPGGGKKQVKLGGESGELQRLPETRAGGGMRGYVLPQLAEFFNGRVEVIVHSPDPDGNVVEEKTEVEMRQIAAAAGGEAPSVDGLVTLVIPPGLEPVVPKGPKEVKRVGGYQNLFFVSYANIPDRKPRVTPGVPRRRDEVDPLPPGLEVVGRPYVIHMNLPPEEPLELRASATQADLSKLKDLTAKLKMKVPEQYSDAVEDPEYLKTRLKVVKWVPAKPETAEPGRWAYVPDIEIEPENRKLIVPANDITTYVIVSERTPPSVREMKPPRGGVVGTFKPEISCLLVDKGVGIAVGAENRIALSVDGRRIPESRLQISKGDPTEVRVTYKPADALSPGRHVVSIRAEDVVENVADVKWHFLVDNKPPSIESVQPAPGERLPVARPLLQARVVDEGGVDVSRVRWSIGGETVPVADLRYDEEAGLLSCVPRRDLDSGVYEAELTVGDHAGLTGTKKWSFAVDVAPPQIVKLTPAPDAYADGEVHEIAVELMDAAGEVRVLDVRLDGRRVPPARRDGDDGYRFKPEEGTLRYVTRTSAGGAHEVRLLYADDLGNAAERAWTFKSRVPDRLVRRPGAGPGTAVAEGPKIPRTDAEKMVFVKSRALIADAERLEARGERRDAIAALRRGIELWPDPAAEAKLQRWRETPPPAGTVGAPEEDPAAVARRQLARKHLADAGYYELKGQTLEALEAYRRAYAATRDPGVEAKIKSLEKASEDLRRRAVAGPTAEDVQRLARVRKLMADGNYLELKGDLPGAIKAFEECLSLKPDPQLEERVKRLKAGQTRQPLSTDTPEMEEKKRLARRARAEGYYQMSRGNAAGAIKAFEESLRHLPDPAIEAQIADLKKKLPPTAPATRDR